MREKGGERRHVEATVRSRGGRSVSNRPPPLTRASDQWARSVASERAQSKDEVTLRGGEGQGLSRCKSGLSLSDPADHTATELTTSQSHCQDVLVSLPLYLSGTT